MTLSGSRGGGMNSLARLEAASSQHQVVTSMNFCRSSALARCRNLTATSCTPARMALYTVPNWPLPRQMAEPSSEPRQICHDRYVRPSVSKVRHHHAQWVQMTDSWPTSQAG